MSRFASWHQGSSIHGVDVVVGSVVVINGCKVVVVDGFKVVDDSVVVVDVVVGSDAGAVVIISGCCVDIIMVSKVVISPDDGSKVDVSSGSVRNKIEIYICMPQCIGINIYSYFNF